jgi:hypothetical protein
LVRFERKVLIVRRSSVYIRKVGVSIRVLILGIALTGAFSACASSGDDNDYSGKDTIPNKLMVKVPESVIKGAAASARAVGDADYRYGQMRDEIAIVISRALGAVVLGMEADELIAQNGLSPSPTTVYKKITYTQDLVDAMVEAFRSMGLPNAEQEARLRAMVGEEHGYPPFVYNVSSDPAYDYSLTTTAEDGGSSSTFYWSSGGNTKFAYWSNQVEQMVSYECVFTYDNALKASSFLIYQKYEVGEAHVRMKIREDGESSKSGIFCVLEGSGMPDMTIYADDEGGGMNVARVYDDLLKIENNPAISCTFNTVGITDLTGNGAHAGKVAQVAAKIAEIPEINPLKP